jgi:UDP-glucose 4-epimerase
MRIAITGASGNVGTALLRRLTGTAELVGVSRRTPPSIAPYRDVEWVPADLSEPGVRTRLADAFAGADAVVHCAWIFQPSYDRQLQIRGNQGGSLAVAQAAVDAGVRQLVHLSSLGAYAPGDPRTPVDESYPTTGVPTSNYSVDKSAVERTLDDFEDRMVISRMRPTLVLQDGAASEIGRYFLGPVWPRLLRPSLFKLLPWPRDLVTQLVHADDVASAIALVLDQRAGGGFNVAAEPVIDRAEYKRIFGGVGPALPPRLLRTVVDATWRAHLQPTDPGWLDLGMSVPLLDTARLRGMGWLPQYRGDDIFRSFVDSLASGRGATGPLLYPRGAAEKV